MVDEKLLNSLMDRMKVNKSIFSAVLCVESRDGSFSWTGAAGEMEKDSKYFIASVTKLYVTAVILQLIEEGRLELRDKISKHLSEDICNGLHVLKGTDYSDQLTITHLLSNTSGIPDYFFHKQQGGRTVADDLMEGKDEAWPLDRTIGLIKELKPKFKPGARGKAAYSDSNYQLLGAIIEKVTGKRISEVFNQYIFTKLNLTNTYIYTDIHDDTPAPFYFKSKQLWLPNYMASVGVEGGIVSTAAEVMIFLKAFFNGQFFPVEKIEELKQWNMILPPPGLFQFGVGLENLWIPGIVSPGKPIKEVLGFWGQTGSFAFYNPRSDLYFTGTTNQINGKGHRLASSAMIKTIKSVL